MLQAYVSSVSYVSEICCKCFRCVVKVDLDVAYVAKVVRKRLFSVFHLYFWTYVVSVFILMLHMFYTYVVNVLSECCVCLKWFSSIFSGVFWQVFQEHV